MPASSAKPRRTVGLRIAAATAVVVAGFLSVTIHLLDVLSDARLARNLASNGLWKRVVAALGGTVSLPAEDFAQLDAPGLILWFLTLTLAAWFGGAAFIGWRRNVSFSSSLAIWGLRGWLWWLLPILWEGLELLSELAGSMSVVSLLAATLPLWHGLMWAGWLTTGLTLVRRPEEAPALAAAEPRVPALLWGAIAAYALVFGAMSCALYESLLLPHGDSAMYEEHLWNLLHGKGFRSYLDNNRLFLGEHVQVIHLAAIPLYVLWPSHLLLELCQSLALALTAIPLFRIAHRHGKSVRAATALAMACLVYVPLQNLDMAVDLKTFRPNSFEIPLFLWAFDAWERGRRRTFFAALGLALLCQEDAAAILAPLGIWIAGVGAFRISDFGFRKWKNATTSEIRNPKSEIATGLGLAAFGVLYLLLVIKVVLPWFRGGADVHFAQYFNELGTSSNSIVQTVFEHPGKVAGRLLDVESIGFALSLLVPLGFLPLLSPGRLAIAAPLFGILCLSDITNSSLHHFHAPLVPVLLWAAAAGLGNATGFAGLVQRGWRRLRNAPPPEEEVRRIPAERFVANGKSLAAEPQVIAAPPPQPAERARLPDPVIVECAGRWGLLSACCVGFFVGLSPLALGFWDPDSTAYWRKLYVPGERARLFSRVLAEIPVQSRVASTDFVHPRFTHYDRSYDYSDYRPDVPADADFIVIDTRHPYSRIRGPYEVKEYRDHPEQWELLPDTTDGYFIVLKRRRSGP